MELDELRIYNQAMEVGERIWKIVVGWDFFCKDTIGKQLIKASDSIAANISEGYGRYHFREVKQFGYYSRGSLYETKTWLKKANDRSLIKKDDYDHLMKQLNELAKMLNKYISSVGQMSEPTVEYETNSKSKNNQLPVTNAQ